RCTTTSRKLRTVGVGLKSHLSSGIASTSPTTRVRVLSHVALAGARKLVGAGWDADAPLPPADVCANAGMAPRITSETTTTLRAKELVRMTPPEAVRGSAHYGTVATPDDRQGGR